MHITIPLEITTLNQILSFLGITAIEQLLIGNDNIFLQMTKLREFLNGKIFALSTFQTLFRTFRKSSYVRQGMNIKRIRLSPTLWIILGRDESLFTISNEMLGFYGYLVTSQLETSPDSDIKADPFQEFSEITEIVY